MSTVVITSYGLGHHDTPQALRPVIVNTLPLRNPPADPAVRERLTRLTGRDPAVRAYVLATPGAQQLIAQAVDRIRQRLGPGQVDVHVYCRGGRHRSVAVAEEIASRLRAQGITVDVVHRHITRPLLPPKGAQ
ncbi:RapZ C-terminal domain-containing protein [Streptomyces olivaceiscleroticus]|uniref:RNase adapter RapZ n=1 Tax=Streptomyces olivaceiscleroticus TaxID=68245 RepID=A0ABP3JI46_9ACTN